jgi:hypothetical protein
LAAKEVAALAVMVAVMVVERVAVAMAEEKEGPPVGQRVVAGTLVEKAAETVVEVRAVARAGVATGAGKEVATVVRAAAKAEAAMAAAAKVVARVVVATGVVRVGVKAAAVMAAARVAAARAGAKVEARAGEARVEAASEAAVVPSEETAVGTPDSVAPTVGE